MKILNDYDKDKLIDRTWYDSSNIIYSECYDKVDDFKEVKIVFYNGRCYLYKGVNVNDYILFREAKSQGKAISRYISKKDSNNNPIYECIRLEDVDVDKVKSEMNNYNSIPTFNINNESGNFKITINNNVIYENRENILNIDNVRECLFEVLKMLHVHYKIKIDNGEYKDSETL